MKVPFNKPCLLLPEQLALLEQKGLIIGDRASAEHWLSHISYFRFKHYSYSFKDYQHAHGNYLPGTTFEMVRDLYLFDRKLRILIFEALESIEVAVKTQLSNIMGTAYGPHWYLDQEFFLSEQEKRQIQRNAINGGDVPKFFDHTAFLKSIEEEMANPTELFLEHYKKTYEPGLPPTWMMIEVITFGTFSLLFENLKSSTEKTELIEHFKLTKKQFVSWMHCFSFIRNKCAHHARVVYAKVKFAPSLPQKQSRQFLSEAGDVENASLYAVLSCIQYMLKVCNSVSSFGKQLLILTDLYSLDYARLGFTPHWRDEELWQY